MLPSSPALERFTPHFTLIVDDIGEATDRALLARNMPAWARLALWTLREGPSTETWLRHLPDWRDVLAVLATDPTRSTAISRLISHVLPIAAGAVVAMSRRPSDCAL